MDPGRPAGRSKAAAGAQPLGAGPPSRARHLFPFQTAKRVPASGPPRKTPFKAPCGLEASSSEAAGRGKPVRRLAAAAFHAGRAGADGRRTGQGGIPPPAPSEAAHISLRGRPAGRFESTARKPNIAAALRARRLCGNPARATRWIAGAPGRCSALAPSSIHRDTTGRGRARPPCTRFRALAHPSAKPSRRHRIQSPASPGVRSKGRPPDPDRTAVPLRHPASEGVPGAIPGRPHTVLQAAPHTTSASGLAARSPPLPRRLRRTRRQTHPGLRTRRGAAIAPDPIRGRPAGPHRPDLRPKAQVRRFQRAGKPAAVVAMAWCRMRDGVGIPRITDRSGRSGLRTRDGAGITGITDRTGGWWLRTRRPYQ